MSSARALPLLAALAVLVAGCGANPAALLGGSHRDPQAYASCMRAHGLPDFPDAKNGGFQVDASPQIMTVNGVTLKESQAQFQSAEQVCLHYLEPPDANAPASPQQQQAALAYAQCMRAHGIPNFPDPKVTAHSFAVHLPPGTDPNAPQFQAAKTACQTLMPGPRGHR